MQATVPSPPSADLARPRRLFIGFSTLFILLLSVQIATGAILLNRWRAQSLSEGTEVVRDTLAYSAAALDRTISQTDAMLKALPVLLSDQVWSEPPIQLGVRLLQAQIDQNQALLDVMIFRDPDGTPVIAAPEGARLLSPDRLAQLRDQRPADFQLTAPIFNADLSAWSIQMSRRLSLSGVGAVHAIASLSIPALATQIAPVATRLGITLSLEERDRTLVRIPFDPNAIGAPTTIRPGYDELSAEKSLSNAPFTLRVSLDPDVALAEWRRDAAWILALSGMICVLEIVAAAIAFAFVHTRVKAKREMERATQELSASRRQAQAAADARGIFIANMNHELRTPLNAVIGFSEILTNELFGPIGNPRYRDYAADIHASGAHLLALINDIIDFSTIDLGHRKLEPKPIELSGALQDALRLIRPQAAARSLRIEISGVRPDDWIIGDVRALRQVLVNILSNAVKFSPPEGVIQILRNHPIGSNALEISIIDQGPGISEAELDRIGEQFYRTVAATESAIGGAGLGLSISRSLMNLMGGTIDVKSESGQGAAVTVRLPKADARALEAAE